MNVLIISEKFCKGGLETQIYTQFCYTDKNKNNLVFAFGNYDSELEFTGAKVYSGLQFKQDLNIEEFCNLVEELVNIIKGNNIEVIHVHPFYSLFPAIFAAKITKIPIVYTFHGNASITFPITINETILLKSALENELCRIFCVSEMGENSVNYNIIEKKTIFFPNVVDQKLFRKHTVIDNKKWAIVSRLDEGKIEPIKKLIQNFDKIDMEEICIYGEGELKGYLEELVKENKIEDKINFMGHHGNLQQELDGKYNGVMGLGRVIVEAMSMEYPIILIGYNKISGVIDKNVYDRIKTKNFINNFEQEISIEELNKQLQDVYNHKLDMSFYTEYKQEYTPEKVYDMYYKELEKLVHLDISNYVKIYEQLKLIQDKKEKIATSENVYKILIQNIEKDTLDIQQKEIFMLKSCCNYYETKINELYELNKINKDII